MICSACFLALGCQSTYRKTAEQVDALELSGQFAEAASVASAAVASNGDEPLNRVIYLLQAARAAQIAGDVEASIRFFDEAYEIVRPFLDTSPEDRVSEAIVTTAVNQTLAEYKGTVVDRIMLSTLQAINQLAKGNFDLARIELNRAGDWQQDAVAKGAKEIAAAEKKLESKADESGFARKSFNVPPQLRQSYENLGDLSAYADWRNPFTSWLRGIFLLANATDDGDLGNARFDLRDVVAMNPTAAPLVNPDLEAIDQMKIQPTTWVVLMSGLAPKLEEFRLDIPIPVGNVNYVAAAFPVLKPREGGVKQFTVQVGEERIDGVLLANMDAVIAADFDRRLPVIVMQEILSAALKTTATWAAREAAGDAGVYAQIAGIIYQAVTTAADLRTWGTLPKFIAAARVPTPLADDLSIYTQDGRLLGQVAVVPEASNLVVLVLPSSAAPAAAIQSFRMNPGPVSVSAERNTSG